jgi:DNA-binding CsgD family transcriptional regulator
MRAHLRSIYAKVGVGRLVDLVRVVASGGAPLAPDQT